MSTWYYYNEQGEKIETTGGRLKGLAKAGMITPETIVETEDGKKARAGKVKGLTFAAPAQPETTPSIEKEIYGLSQPKPSVEVNPFTAPKLEEVNPFTAAPSVVSKPAEETPFADSKQTTHKSFVHKMGKWARKNKRVVLVAVCFILLLSPIIWWATVAATNQAKINSFLARFQEYGNDVNAVNERGDTLLHLAVCTGYLDENLPVVKYLVSKGANVNAKNNQGYTPLYGAQNIKIAKYLISKGADIHAKNHEGSSQVIQSIYTDTVKYLILQGADVNAKSNDNYTNLHGAAQLGKLELVKFLISRGADINVKYKGKETPLDLAKRNNKNVTGVSYHSDNTAVIQYLSGLSGVTPDLPHSRQTSNSTVDSSRVMKDVLRKVESMESFMIAQERVVTSSLFERKLNHDTVRSRVRQDIEYAFDVSKCPQDFQTAFEKYKSTLKNYMESMLEWDNKGSEVDLRWKTRVWEGDAPFRAAERERDAASSVVDRERERMKSAKKDLEFIVNRHTR